MAWLLGTSQPGDPVSSKLIDEIRSTSASPDLLVTAKMYRKLRKFSDGNVTNGKWQDGDVGIPGISVLEDFLADGKARKLGFRKVNGQWIFDSDQEDTYVFDRTLRKKVAFSCMEIGRASDRMVPSIDDSSSRSESAPVSSVSPINEVSVTLINKNCWSQDFYLNDQRLATIPARMSQVLTVRAGTYTTRACTAGTSDCGDATLKSWTAGTTSHTIFPHPNCTAPDSADIARAAAEQQQRD